VFKKKKIATIFDKENSTESSFSIVPEKIDETRYFFRDKREITEIIDSNHTSSLENEAEKILKIEIEKTTQSKQSNFIIIRF
jgi:hypothetical protein